MPAAPGRRFVFAGPTLGRGEAAGMSFALDDLVVLPPVKRGDVQRIASPGARPGVLAIVDGYFHLQHLAVGHQELRLAIEAGWQVWGLSSMGALRAVEMRGLGLRGYGEVYARYVGDPTFRDDEVALLHEPGPPYRTFSEPLVHVRAGLEQLVAEGGIDVPAAAAVVAALSRLWFGDRTLARIAEEAARHLPRAQVDTWIARFDEFQLKSRDLARFLEERPWEVAGAA